MNVHDQVRDASGRLGTVVEEADAHGHVMVLFTAVGGPATVTHTYGDPKTRKRFTQSVKTKDSHVVTTERHAVSSLTLA